MAILFDEIVFGPVKSRRLGISLGINLLPTDHKLCTFNCIYCECGWTELSNPAHAKFFSREDIRDSLEKRLAALLDQEFAPDAVTFAGNGEPTLHPDFPEIVDDTVELTAKFFPDASVAVLSNSSTLGRPGILDALRKVKCIMKLDAGNDEMFSVINSPKISISIDEIVENLKKFNGKVNTQSMFFRGNYNGNIIDNAADEEVEAWLKKIKEINPEMVMIYSIDRRPPALTLEKLPVSELEKIAVKVRNEGLLASVF